jgi:hypothetical protein
VELTKTLNVPLRRPYSSGAFVSEQSKVFELLNGSTIGYEADVDGLVAYALYKQHKRDWCEQFQEERGAPPTSQEKLDFSKSVSTPGQLERYLKDAQDALGEFAGSLIDEEAPKIAEAAITGRIELAASRIENQSSFKSMVLFGVISTLISTSTLILLAVGIRLLGIDLLSAVDALGGAR